MIATVTMTREDVGEVNVNNTPEDIAVWEGYGFALKAPEPEPDPKTKKS